MWRGVSNGSATSLSTSFGFSTFFIFITFSTFSSTFSSSSLMHTSYTRTPLHGCGPKLFAAFKFQLEMVAVTPAGTSKSETAVEVALAGATCVITIAVQPSGLSFKHAAGLCAEHGLIDAKKYPIAH